MKRSETEHYLPRFTKEKENRAEPRSMVSLIQTTNSPSLVELEVRDAREVAPIEGEEGQPVVQGGGANQEIEI